MMRTVTVGFVALTDAAPLIVAKELGFAEEEGLDLHLSRENSWSAIRDKLSFGLIDAAHMLSPMAIAMSLGLGTAKSPTHAVMVLSQNGNSFLAGQELHKELTALGAKPFDAASLGAALIARAQTRPVKIAVPFMTSMHVALLQFLVQSCGGDPRQCLDFVVSPPHMVDRVLHAGEVEGFMAGAPWSSVAAARGLGEIMLNGSDIWQGAPEKVLAATADWLVENTDQSQRLIRAVYRAGLWAAQSSSRAVLSEILSRPQYLGQSAEIIEQTLSGEMIVNGQGKMVHDPLAIRFGGAEISFPWKSCASWIAQHQAQGWGVQGSDALRAAQSCFRTDLYRAALGGLNISLPNASQKVEGLHPSPKPIPASGELIYGPDAFYNGAIFDPA